MRRRTGLIALLALAALGATAYLAASFGSRMGLVTLEIGWPQLWADGGDGVLSAVIANLRVPRVAAAILTGASLAVAGLLLQGVSRNPLADPFLLGISGGAGLAVVVLHAVPGLIETLGWWCVPVAAFAGAQLATMLVLAVARGPGGRMTMLGLILGGVIINSFCAAITTFLLVSFAPLQLRITTMWLAGGVGYVDWSHLAGAFVAFCAAFVFIRFRSSDLNAFALGEEGALLVGVDSRRLVRETAWTASLLTGLAVSMAGMVGYIGLIVPHLVRFLVGNDFKSTLVLSALIGALLLLVGDTAARTVMAPQEIPVGVLAAIIGTPLLLVLIKRELGGGR